MHNRSGGLFRQVTIGFLLLINALVSRAACPIGFYHTTITACAPCLPGMFSSSQGAGSCTDAVAGRYAANPAARLLRIDNIPGDYCDGTVPNSCRYLTLAKVALFYKGTPLTGLKAVSSSYTHPDVGSNIFIDDYPFTSGPKTPGNDPWLYIDLGGQLFDTVLVANSVGRPADILGARISVVANITSSLWIYESQFFPSNAEAYFTFTFPNNHLYGMTSATPCPAGTYVTAAKASGCVPVPSGAYPYRTIPIASPASVNWYGIVANADFTKLAVAVMGSYMKKSGDAGATWSDIVSGGRKKWMHVHANSDFTQFIACADDDDLWRSIDGAASWSSLSVGTHKCRGVAASSDFQKIIAVDNDDAPYGNVRMSTNSGSTWSILASAGSRAWGGITCDANMDKIAASVCQSGYIYISQNSGSTWTEIRSAGARNWLSIAASASFEKLAVVENGKSIYISLDSGATWSAVPTSRGGSAPSDASWRGIYASADFSKLVATASVEKPNSGVYMSYNGGAYWKITDAYDSVALGATGIKVCAAGTFSAALNTGCTACPAGKYAIANSEICTDCVAGKYLTQSENMFGGTSESSCISCPAGKHSSIPGAASSTTCLNCDAGEYSVGTGNTECTACGPATVSSPGSSACNEFPNGRELEVNLEPSGQPTQQPVSDPTSQPTTSPTSNPTRRRSRPTRSPTPVPTLTFEPTHLLSYVSLSFKIQGLERTDITTAMEKAMVAVLSSVLKLPLSSFGAFVKVDIEPRGARIRRNLIASKAIRITTPLLVTIFSTTQWAGSVVNTDADVLAYVTTKFTASANALSNNYINQVLQKLSDSSRSSRDTQLLNAIQNNASLMPYLDPVDIFGSNSHPTQAPTDYILPIGADKPSENAVGIALYSVLGAAGAMMLAYIAKHLRRHFLMKKQQALLQEKKKKANASTRKVVKRAMTVLHMGVSGLANGSSKDCQSMAVGSAVESGDGKNAKVAPTSPMHAFAYKKISPLPQDDPHDEETWTTAVPAPEI